MTGQDGPPESHGEAGYLPINRVVADLHAEHQAAGDPCPDWCPHIADERGDEPDLQAPWRGAVLGLPASARHADINHHQGGTMSNYDGADFGEIEPELDPEPPARPRRWPRVVGIVVVLLLGAAAGWIARPAVIPTEVDQAAPRPAPTVTITATPEVVDRVGSSTVPPACLEALDITERLIDWIGRYDQAVTEGASDEEFQLLEEEITNLGGLWGMTEPVCREPIN